MATKLDNDKTVERELSVTIKDNNGVERELVAELQADGTVKLRLKGMKRVVEVDLLGALGIGRDTNDPKLVTTEQPMTAKKRSFLEHLMGK